MTTERLLTAPPPPPAPTVPARPPLGIELLVVLALVRVYDWIRTLPAERRGRALDNAQHIWSLERWLGLDWEQAANSWLTRHQAIQFLAAGWYQLTHLSVTLTILAWCYWRRPDIYRPARNALVGINLVGLGVFAVLPVMPPRLLPTGEFVDSVAAAGLGTAPAGPITPDQYGAMPSLHLAWATWALVVALVLAGRSASRWLWLAYPTTTGVVVILTANHFILDVFAGVGVAIAALSGAGLVRRPARWATVRRAVAGAISQTTRQRSSIAKTQAPGTSGAQTVIKR